MERMNADIQVENNRRIKMWAKLKDIEKKRKQKNEYLTPNDVREVGCYGGGRGIWRDASKTTGHLTNDGCGICIGILSIGKYDDNIDGESGKYDYPSTKNDGYDLGDIKSMRSAYKYDLPVFLIQNINQRGEIVTEKSKYRKVDLIKFIDDCSYDKHLIFTSSEGGKNDYELPENIEKSCFQKRELKTTKSKKKKRSQAAFRAAVIKRFEFVECLICDAPKEVIEAAHIVPVENNGSDWDENGLLLCRNHHSLFDKGLWAINPENFEIISTKNMELSIMQIEKTDLNHLVKIPDKNALIWRWKSYKKNEE